MGSGDDSSFGWDSDDNNASNQKDDSSDDSDVDNKVRVKEEPVSSSGSSSEDELPRVPIKSEPIDYMDEDLANDRSAAMNDFIAGNPKLVTATWSDDLKVKKDDEVWLVQCPKDFSIDSAAKHLLPNYENGETKIPGTSYESIASDDKERVILLIPPTKERGCVINSIPLMGKILLRERLKKLTAGTVSKDNTIPKVAFPSDLKVRHPLFGVDYKKQIELNETVKDKLKKKAKNKKSKIVLEETIVEESILEKKHKKKRKASLEPELEKPSKKRKKESDDWESELSIEKNLFEMPKRKLK